MPSEGDVLMCNYDELKIHCVHVCMCHYVPCV